MENAFVESFTGPSAPCDEMSVEWPLEHGLNLAQGMIVIGRSVRDDAISGREELKVAHVGVVRRWMVTVRRRLPRCLLVFVTSCGSI
jgi:hypothetical protein